MKSYTVFPKQQKENITSDFKDKEKFSSVSAKSFKKQFAFSNHKIYGGGNNHLI